MATVPGDHQDEQTSREQLLESGQSVSAVVRTTLGPNGHDKMLVGEKGKVLVTNDGARILERIEISDPVGRAVVRAAGSQRQAVGDGTTTTVVLTGALLSRAGSLLDEGVHPTTVIDGFHEATGVARDRLRETATAVDRSDRALLEDIAKTTVTGRWDEANTDRFAELTVSGLQAVGFDRSKLGVEAYPGGELGDSELVDGLLIDMETSPATVDDLGSGNRTVPEPRVAMVNSEITIEKPDAVASVTLERSEQAERLRSHEQSVREEAVATITGADVDVLFCQKSIDDTVRNSLFRAGVLAVERTRQDQFDAICRATGARAVQSIDQLIPEAVGHAGSVRRRTVGQTETLQVVDCPLETQRTLLLRGGTPHVAEETERIVEECSETVQLALRDGVVVPGGGASAMALSREVAHHASGVADRTHLVIEAFTDALEQIPGVLATNAGRDPIDTLTTLRSRHAAGDRTAGIAGTGEVVGMIDAGIVEPHAVFDRSLVIALEAASMILRIDEVVSTPSKETEQGDATRARGHGGPDSGGYPWAISH